MNIADDDPLVRFAERITVTASQMGIATALIGATAWAACSVCVPMSMTTASSRS